MEKKAQQELKQKIDHAQIVSFDLYGTLIFRKHGTPQEVFRLLGCLVREPDFQKARVRMQQKAYRQVKKAYGYPHPTLHEIYQYGAELDGYHKQAFEHLERRLERYEAFPNRAMRRILDYAHSLSRRIVVVTDMYLEKEEICKILRSCGYENIDGLYVSSELKRTKYDGSMYEELITREGIPPEKILQIGDDSHADIKMADRFGICTFHYTDGEKDYADSLRQNIRAENRIGHLKAVCGETNRKKLDDCAFWYLTGWHIGGPLYMGLCTWIRKKIEGRRLYCLSRDGYNLMKVLGRFGMEDCQYIYASRRALLLPAIDRLGNRELAMLPPYSCGQTVEEVLEYLNLTGITKSSLIQQGFSGYGDVIRTKGDIARMKKVYALNASYILGQCARERKNLERYFRAQGLFESQVLFFDSGWNGTSQYLIERIYRLLGIRSDIEFLYAGIKRNARSSQNLRNSRYHAFFNESLTYGRLNMVLDGAAVLELFFSQDAPALLHYGDQGPVFEMQGEEAAAGGRKDLKAAGGVNDLKAIESGFYEGQRVQCQLCGKKNAVAVRFESSHITWINQGLQDYVSQNSSLIREKWSAGIIRYAICRISELLINPSPLQAKKIGDLENTDRISASSGMKKYIARIPLMLLFYNPYLDIYWERGVYRHPKNCLYVKVYVFFRQRAAHWKNSGLLKRNHKIFSKIQAEERQERRHKGNDSVCQKKDGI